MTGPSFRSSITRAYSARPGRRRRRRRRTRDPRRALAPYARAAGRRRPRASLRRPCPLQHITSARQSASTASRVVRQRRGGVRARRHPTFARRRPAVRRAPTLRSQPRPPRALRARASTPCRRCRGRWQHTTTSNPAAFAHARADAVDTQWTSPSTQAPTAMAVWSRPRASSSRTASESGHGQRAAGKLGVRDARIRRRCPRMPAPPGCEASSRRRACRRDARRARSTPRRAPLRAEATCTGASSRAHRARRGGRARG